MPPSTVAQRSGAEMLGEPVVRPVQLKRRATGRGFGRGATPRIRAQERMSGGDESRPNVAFSCWRGLASSVKAR